MTGYKGDTENREGFPCSGLCKHLLPCAEHTRGAIKLKEGGGFRPCQVGLDRAHFTLALLMQQWKIAAAPVLVIFVVCRGSPSLYGWVGGEGFGR